MEATRKASLVILSIPHSAIDEILKRIGPGLDSGDVVLSVIVPLSREEVSFTVPEMDHGSAAEKVESMSPPGVSVVSAFQGVPAKLMSDFESEVNSDIPVSSDDEDAKEDIFGVIEEIPGARPIDAGPLSNSRLVETMAAFFVELTRIHGNEVSLRFQGI